jgi:hypothetical protein
MLKKKKKKLQTNFIQSLLYIGRIHICELKLIDEETEKLCYFNKY